ncbi:MAG: hypothetical protein NTV03_02985 [Candidatus Nomurabacteria bacterium]|nr:hypothetical protein [Candidatus Nomurabacteria bacterium]
MSINDFMNKIKGKIGIDSMTLVCFCIIVLVSLGSFGLGRLSVAKIDNVDQLNVKEEGINISKKEGDMTEAFSAVPKEKLYVASKNGKLYYSLGCTGAKRIAPKNEVWFASSIDAEKSGYTLSTSCK